MIKIHHLVLILVSHLILSLQLARQKLPEVPLKQYTCQSSSFSRIYTSPLQQIFLLLDYFSSKALRAGFKPVH